MAACGGESATTHQSGPSVPVTWNHQDQCQGAGFGQTQNPTAAKLPIDFPAYPGVQVLLAPHDSGSGMVSAAWTVSHANPGPTPWCHAHLQDAAVHPSAATA